jgi:hypothetical protein
MLPGDHQYKEGGNTMAARIGGSKAPISIIVILVIILAVAGIFSKYLVETNNAGYIKIRQMPVSGTLGVYTDAGMFGQWFGLVTEYQQAGTYSFTDEALPTDQLKDSAVSAAVEVRFNDGGIARLTGNARFELPLEPAAMTKIHNKFRSYDHISQSLVKPAIGEALILTASLMSAEESYSGRRAEFSQLAWDQVLNGVYITESEERETVDPTTGEKKNKRIVHIKYDNEGKPVRKQNSLALYEIRITQFFLDKDFGYESGVLQQISNQRDAMMKTVAAKAEAEKSQQDRLTAEAQGQANVMTAKYEAEVEKERAVVEARKRKEVAETEAAQRLEVAKLDKTAAEEYKQMQLLRADGDAEYKRRVMQADGALAQKLEAWIDVNKRYAQAIENYKGNWVPNLVMGGSGTGSTMGSQDLINLLTAKTAKELALDLSLPTGSTNAPQ